MRTRRRKPGIALPASPVRLAIDTGGTFTDCVWISQGGLHLHKVFSTPADPSQAILRAVEEAGAATSPLLLLHGTTVGTNALLRRRGARVAFVTTKGFEDTIEIGRQNRPKLYDFFFDQTPPLVARSLRFGVRERTDRFGNILTAPSSRELKNLRNLIARQAVDSVAVSLLFSFANPANELAVAAALKDLKLPISLSHVILREFREYERASTVVINAYLQPLMQGYLENLEAQVIRLRAYSGKKTSAKAPRPGVFVMQSNGGITSVRSAVREPVRTLLSGPAGGVVGASVMARRSGFDRIISLDMGGTSTDVALVRGEPTTSSEGEIASLPVRVPMLNIHTVGAGGGSIARFDAAGSLRVGPQSAGADPGPICYGRGLDPTVSDANLLLGRLQPENFLGGSFTLDLARTRSVVSAWLKAQRSRLSLLEFAAGVIKVVNSTMEKAIRVVSLERGYDPRDFTLVAFGGAGGLHACELAAALRIPRVVVPRLPGALSAYGILVSDVVRDYSQTVLWGADSHVQARLQNAFLGLERRARNDLKSEPWQGRIRFSRTADLRYQGQGFELNIPSNSELVAGFHREHERRYGYSHPEREVEIVTLRLRASIAQQSQLQAPEVRWRPAGRGKSKTAAGVEQTLSASANRPAAAGSAAIIPRDSLSAGRKYRGPAVITEYSATTFVPRGVEFRIDPAGNLLLALK